MVLFQANQSMILTAQMSAPYADIWLMAVFSSEETPRKDIWNLGITPSEIMHDPNI